MSAEQNRAKVLDVFASDPHGKGVFSQPSQPGSDKQVPKQVMIAGQVARAVALDNLNSDLHEQQAIDQNTQEELRQQKLRDDVIVKADQPTAQERIKVNRLLPLFQMHSEAIAGSSDKQVIEQHLSQMLKGLGDHVTTMSKDQRVQLADMLKNIAPTVRGDKSLLAKYTTLLNMLEFHKKPVSVAPTTAKLPSDFMELHPSLIAKKYKNTYKIADWRRIADKYGLKSNSKVGLIGKIQQYIRDRKGGVEEFKGVPPSRDIKLVPPKKPSVISQPATGNGNGKTVEELVGKKSAPEKPVEKPPVTAKQTSDKKPAAEKSAEKPAQAKQTGNGKPSTALSETDALIQFLLKHAKK